MLNAVLGAVAGAAAAAASLWLAVGTASAAPYIVMVVLVITLIGLSLGAIAALCAYVVAGVILLVGAVPPPGEVMAEPDLLRLLVFAFGSPVVIVLGLRSEWQQREDRAAQRGPAARPKSGPTRLRRPQTPPGRKPAMPWTRSSANEPGWRTWRRRSPSR